MNTFKSSFHICDIILVLLKLEIVIVDITRNDVMTINVTTCNITTAELGISFTYIF